MDPYEPSLEPEEAIDSLEMTATQPTLFSAPLAMADSEAQLTTFRGECPPPARSTKEIFLEPSLVLSMFLSSPRT